jgi:hypothetical protein
MTKIEAATITPATAAVHLPATLDVPVGRLMRRRIVTLIPGVYAMLAPCLDRSRSVSKDLA